MCTCASCEYTDGFKNAGFTSWPSGDPAGKRASDAAYQAHARYGQKWGKNRRPECSKVVSKSGTRREDPHAHYAFEGKEYYEGYTKKYRHFPETTREYVELWLRLNKLKEASPALAEPARPATPCKAPQHLPAQDRPREPAASLPQSYRVEYSANDSEGDMPAKFMTVVQAAKSWGASQPRIRQWLADDRIKGALKIGRDWLIPANAQRPKAARPGELQAASKR